MQRAVAAGHRASGQMRASAADGQKTVESTVNRTDEKRASRQAAQPKETT
ncbi:hypothetical protein BSIN_5092 [Burkholderia singularis]|uniref:Uncharacterized protein n=1 Tax=Burkholderia singularis TaxID=1503053 RepID=A0A238HAR9_9BURK|nr:hypothetical protein BSIN_5092 [Burkholderia singularis]